MTDALHAVLTLTFTPGLGPRKIKGLLEHFGAPSALAGAEAGDLLAVEGIGRKLAGSVVAARREAGVKADAELARAERQGVTLLALGTPGYPEALGQIYDPPAVLYVRGSLPDGVHGSLERLRSLGVVGTRNATPYGLELSRRLAQELAAQGVAIVSGLALGVDTAAHEGALAAPGGETVAVLGSGVDVVYPGQNRRLAERLLAQGGALVSEYRLGTAPRAENFPGRNRIINGLSRGILVVEGGKKSGALITADYALEEGRTIFAVPGRVGDPRAEGPLELLRQGAVLTQRAADITDEFGWRAPSAPSAAPSGAASTTLSGLPAELAALIRDRGEPLLDDLIVATGKSAPELLPTLMTLELSGVIRTLPSGRYST
jgi:DNA processing protein